MITSKHSLLNGWVLYERGREGFLALHPFGYMAWQDEVEVFVRDSLGTVLTVSRNLATINLDHYVSRTDMSGEPAGDEWQQFIDDIFEYSMDFINEHRQNQSLTYNDVRELVSTPATKRLIEVAKSKQTLLVEPEHAVFS
jgi:hypothetical protein